MAKYNTASEIWKTLGSDSFIKVRDELVGTPIGACTLDFSVQNVISGSETIYLDDVRLTSGYTINYDDGRISFTTASTGGQIKANFDYSTVPDSQVQALLNQADAELELMTGRNFDVTTTSEYIDVEPYQTVFWTTYYPVIGITASCNTASDVTDTPSWRTGSEGIGNDYLMDSNDKLIGKLEFIDNGPLSGKKRLKLEYSYGYTTIPYMVKELNALLTIKKMVNSTVYKAIVMGRDSFSPIRLAEIEDRIAQLTGMLRKQKYNRI